jgi:hypothetical protein
MTPLNRLLFLLLPQRVFLMMPHTSRKNFEIKNLERELKEKFPGLAVIYTFENQSLIITDHRRRTYLNVGYTEGSQGSPSPDDYWVVSVTQGLSDQEHYEEANRSTMLKTYEDTLEFVLSEIKRLEFETVDPMDEKLSEIARMLGLVGHCGGIKRPE